MKGRCQCENGSHFDLASAQLKPAPHQYGFVSELTEVKTPYGVFNVCKTCADTCLEPYKSEQR
jgi:hypothetical protein